MISSADYLEWKRQNTVFQDLNAWTGGSFNIATRDEPWNVEARVVTPGLNRMLGTPFVLGRDFTREESLPGSSRVVIFTNKFWKRLGANPHVIGTSIRIGGEPYTVVGVLGPGLTDRGQGEIVVPLALRPEQINHEQRWLLAMGRLKPGVTIPAAQAAMDAIAGRLALAYPASDGGWRISVEPFQNDFIPRERIATLWLLLSAVGFVLLIACVNVANLLLARSVSRQKELAVRSALGAKPRALFGQLLIESLTLATVGGVLGIVVGYGMLQALVALTPPNTLPSEADFRLNVPVLAFTVLMTSLAGLLFGCVPAWFASRANAGVALREGPRSGTSAGRRRLQQVLVTGEVALALTLLAGAGLAIHSFWNLLQVNLGVRTDHLRTFRNSLPASRPRNPEWLAAYYRHLLARMEAVPEVSAAVTTGIPMEGPGLGSIPFSTESEASAVDPSQRMSARLGAVTPGFFHTFGVQVKRGRPFNESDTRASIKVAAVNEEFVSRYVKGRNPVGQVVWAIEPIVDPAAHASPISLEIVAVLHNIRSRGLRDDLPEIYVPFWQLPWPDVAVGVRTSGDPAKALDRVTSAVHAVDADIALAQPRTMFEVRNEVLASDRFNAILFSSFAAMALLLAILGIYGVMAFATAQRSHEIALRLALGANRRALIGLVMKDGLKLTGFGMILGLIGAYLMDRAMRSVLFGVGSTDFVALGVVVSILMAAACAACYLPTRRAVAVDPARLLRTD